MRSFADGGLVSISTSSTPEIDSLIELSAEDAWLRRVRRMRNDVMGTARAVEDELRSGGKRYKTALITGTYRPGVEWSPKHITSLLNCYYQWAKRRRIKLVALWTLELQERGAPHYHILMWIPHGYTPPMPDKQGWWKHGMSNAKWARSPVGYIAKYASKGTEGILPTGARLWGFRGLSRHILDARSWWSAPKWLREMVPLGHRIRRLVGGWWQDTVHNIRYRSPWEYVNRLSGGGKVVLRWRGWGLEDVVMNNDPAGFEPGARFLGPLVRANRHPRGV